MRTLTMITRHGVSKDNISAYTLMTPEYQTVTMKASELLSAITEKKVFVTNMGICNKGIVSTNGATDKYTFINTATNQVDGTPRAVIIDRVEQNEKLIGYTVFMQNGVMAELSIADAAALAHKGLISNGKVRHTTTGDIVSAIGGTYPLRVIAMDKAPKGEISMDVLYFATVVNTTAEYFGAIVSCTSATEMSKLMNILSKSNAKIISTVAKVAGQSVRESLALKRMGTNSFYGVFETEILERLVTKDAKVHNRVGKIPVSAVRYIEDSVDEATLKLNKEWKVAEQVDGTDSLSIDRVVKYAKKVEQTFKDVKIV